MVGIDRFAGMEMNRRDETERLFARALGGASASVGVEDTVGGLGRCPGVLTSCVEGKALRLSNTP